MYLPAIGWYEDGRLVADGNVVGRFSTKRDPAKPGRHAYRVELSGVPGSGSDAFGSYLHSEVKGAALSSVRARMAQRICEETGARGAILGTFQDGIHVYVARACVGDFRKAFPTAVFCPVAGHNVVRSAQALPLVESWCSAGAREVRLQAPAPAKLLCFRICKSWVRASPAARITSTADVPVSTLAEAVSATRDGRVSNWVLRNPDDDGSEAEDVRFVGTQIPHASAVSPAALQASA